MRLLKNIYAAMPQLLSTEQKHDFLELYGGYSQKILKCQGGCRYVFFAIISPTRFRKILVWKCFYRYWFCAVMQLQ